MGIFNFPLRFILCYRADIVKLIIFFKHILAFVVVIVVVVVFKSEDFKL